MPNKIGTYDTQSARDLSIEGVKELFSSQGCEELFIKELSPNDNSKNQPYLAGHLNDLSFLPTGETEASLSDSNKPTAKKQSVKYQAALNLSWIDSQGQLYPAPRAKLIYYPQYPETRLSGFLLGSKVRISEWMQPDKRGRSEGRWLILSVTEKQQILAYLVTPDSELSRSLQAVEFPYVSGVFGVLSLLHSGREKSPRTILLEELYRIHKLGWLQGSKLSADGKLEPYAGKNAGGYTLEAHLGVKPNGIAEPDFMGWEVKQFGVTRFPNVGAKVTTLMTPEPDGGQYKDDGIIEFMKRYGYPALSGEHDRLNFGGKHTAFKQQERTTLTMELIGYDFENKEVFDANGSIALINPQLEVAASWSFAKIMNHWKKKHAQAAFVPCIKRELEYHFGSVIKLGKGASFQQLLSAFANGYVYYDPGINLKYASTDKPKSKKRSQFRVAHKNISGLYQTFESVQLPEIN